MFRESAQQPRTRTPRHGYDGLAGRRVCWQEATEILQLFQQKTKDNDSTWGKKFRAITGCSRDLFDEILSQLRSSRLTWTRDGTERDVHRWLLDVAGSHLNVNGVHIPYDMREAIESPDDADEQIKIDTCVYLENMGCPWDPRKLFWHTPDQQFRHGPPPVPLKLKLAGALSLAVSGLSPHAHGNVPDGNVPAGCDADTPAG